MQEWKSSTVINSGSFTKNGKVTEKRIGMKSLLAHECDHSHDYERVTRERNCAYALRNSHTLSLDHHSRVLPETANVKEKIVLQHRASSYPAYVPDNSCVLLEETVHRRHIHKDEFARNNKAFSR